MANEWILDVLADLTTFAEKNGLPALEEQLVRTARIAVKDLDPSQGISLHAAKQGTGHVGILRRTTAGGQNA